MTDLFIRRVYEHQGIKVVVDIDLVKKTISFVDGNSFVPKKWVFAERTLEYLNGWELIFQAMRHAAKEAGEVLKQVEKRDQEKFLALMIDLDNPKLRHKI